jgi:1-aminocyclopropane-1-carboxylate deaminase/D-cysteine desulfhydrase-like pyridoxal-dependent ACC family enzyme
MSVIVERKESLFGRYKFCRCYEEVQEASAKNVTQFDMIE